MKLGKIEPVKISAEQVSKNQAPESTAGFLWTIPAFMFAVLIIIFLLDKATCKIVCLFFAAFIGFYIFAIFHAVKISRNGEKKKAAKRLLAVFAPLLGTANLALYTFLKSDMVKPYYENAKNGIQLLKSLLLIISPKYGTLICAGLIGTIIIGLNLIFIKGFDNIIKNLPNNSSAAEEFAAQKKQ